MNISFPNRACRTDPFHPLSSTSILPTVWATRLVFIVGLRKGSSGMYRVRRHLQAKRLEEVSHYSFVLRVWSIMLMLECHSYSNRARPGPGIQRLTSYPLHTHTTPKPFDDRYARLAISTTWSKRSLHFARNADCRSQVQTPSLCYTFPPDRVTTRHPAREPLIRLYKVSATTTRTTTRSNRECPTARPRRKARGP